MYQKAGNEYKLKPFKYGPKNFCEFTNDEKLFYPEIILYTNFPPIPICDFEPKVYTIDKYIPNLKNVPPVFESGDYALEVKIFQKGTFVNGYTLYGSILNIGGQFG